MPISLDPAIRRVLSQRLCGAFPDAHVSSDDVEAMALALRLGTPLPVPPELCGLDWSSCADQLDALAREQIGASVDPDQPTTTPLPASKAVRYYWVEATHARQHPQGYDPFVGQLAMVRVSLPAEIPATFHTAIGTVEPEDHLIATVAEANDKFATPLGYPLARVDIVTPPRQKLRFGAVSVMLGYRDALGQPSCYILEAGTATGQAKVLFLGKTLDSAINQYSGYKPTPFACSDHAYTGTLALQGDSPSLLHITARKVVGGQSQPPYMALRASFLEETATIRNIWSGLLIARAALIVWERQARGIPDGCDKKELV